MRSAPNPEPGFLHFSPSHLPHCEFGGVMNDNSENAIDLLHDLIGRASRAGADAADAVLSRAPRCRMAAGSARPRSSNARKATISACASSSAGSRRSCRRATGRRRRSTSSSSAPWRWPGRCPRTPIAASPSPARSPANGRRSTCPTPQEPSAEVLDRARARRRGSRARGPRRHQFRRRRGRLGPLARSRSSPRTALPAPMPDRARGSAPR